MIMKYYDVCAMNPFVSLIFSCLPTLAKAAGGSTVCLLKRLGAAQDHGGSTFAIGTRRLC